MHPYVGHLTVPVVGLPTEPGEEDPAFSQTWLPSVQACHDAGMFLGLTGLMEERCDDGTWGLVEHIGVVVDLHGATKILFAADRILEAGGPDLLCAAYEALQHRQRHIPYHRLFSAWKAHKPSGETIYAKVFSHPKGWVVGLETPRDFPSSSFEAFDDLDMGEGDGDGGHGPLDLTALEEDGEMDMGAIAAVIVPVDPHPSAHATLRAMEDAREVYAAWRRACPHWTSAGTLGIPEDLPIEMSSHLAMADMS